MNTGMTTTMNIIMIMNMAITMNRSRGRDGRR